MRFEFSAGGIVIKHEKHKDYVLVCQHSQHHGWVFPKGLIGPSTGSGQANKSERKEEAALREVKEETGVVGKILQELASITYWYVLRGEKIKKTVYYFLMEYVSGETSDHDHEMEAVAWLPMEKVEKKLTYKSDKEVWENAKQFIIHKS